MGVLMECRVEGKDMIFETDNSPIVREKEGTGGETARIVEEDEKRTRRTGRKRRRERQADPFKRRQGLSTEWQFARRLEATRTRGTQE